LARLINIEDSSNNQGYLIARKDNNIRTIDDMKGKSLALVENTTAGFVFPIAWFKRYGVDDIETYFSELFITGSHDRTIALVLNNKAVIGAAKITIYKKMQRWQPRINSELIILANSPKVPSNTLCVSKNLDQKYREQLKELLLNMRGYPDGREALKQLGAKRYVETTTEQYQSVLNLAEEAGINLGEHGLHTPRILNCLKLQKLLYERLIR
jgi:phosphonate transport system substrate-binding protein